MRNEPLSCPFSAWVTEEAWPKKILFNLPSVDKSHSEHFYWGTDKNHTRMSTSRVSSWLWSHPVGSYPWDQGRTIDPYQDRLFQNLTISPWHHSPSATFHSPNDGSHLQRNRATSSLKDHSIIKSYSRGLPWDFCWNPQETFQDLGFKISFKPKLVHL